MYFYTILADTLVDLFTALDFGSDGAIPFSPKTFDLVVKNLSDLVAVEISPKNALVLVNSTKRFKCFARSLTTPANTQNGGELQLLDGAYGLSVVDADWKVLPPGVPIPPEVPAKAHLPKGIEEDIIPTVVGTHTIQAKVHLFLQEKNQKKAGTTATMPAEGKFLTHKGFKIKRMPGGEPATHYDLSYKGVTYFQTVIQMETDVPVISNWKLDGGLVDPEKQPMRASILGELGVKSAKIGAINGVFSDILKSSEASFSAFLQGEITLQAERDGLFDSVSIKIKKPILFLSFKLVEGASVTPILGSFIDRSFEKVKEIWGQEEIIDIQVRNWPGQSDPFHNVKNQDFSASILASTSSCEDLVLYKHKVVGFLNPLVYDGRAHEKYKVNVVPRQSEALLKNYRGQPGDLNIYFSNFGLGAYRSPSTPLFFYLNPVRGGWSFNREDHFRREDSQRLDDHQESGILVFDPNNVDEKLPDKSFRVLSHEIGHLIIEFGDEHDVPKDNLMNPATGDKLLPQQFIKSLNLDGTNPKPLTSVFFVEM